MSRAFGVAFAEDQHAVGGLGPGGKQESFRRIQHSQPLSAGAYRCQPDNSGSCQADLGTAR